MKQFLLVRALKQIPLYIWILVFMMLGVGWGFVVIENNLTNFQTSWISPWGDIFMRLLKFIAVPLVITSIVSGILSLPSVKQLFSLAWKTFTLYILTTLIAIIVGLVLVNIIQPGNAVTAPKAPVSEVTQAPQSENATAAEANKTPGLMGFIVDMVPENFFLSASNNTAMLQIIMAALLMGIALQMMPEGKRKNISSFFHEASEMFSVMIRIVMYIAPLGVFALISKVVVNYGGQSGIFIGLGQYMLTVIAGLFFMMLVFYPLTLYIIRRNKPFGFIRGMFPAQLVAFTTSSSAATLPVTTMQVQKKLGVSEEISGFVLPLGATINMDGTSLYQAVSAVFIAQIYHLDLTMADQMTILFTALIASIGSPGIPGGSIVMMMVVLGSIGIPAEGLALILGVDRLLDMLRTTVNVTGDAFVCCLLHKKVAD